MPVTIQQKPDLGRSSSHVELRYDVTGTQDDAEAHNELAAFAPVLYDYFGTGLIFLPRSDIRLEWVGESHYLGIVEYSTLAPGDEPVFTFDTSGRTEHVVTSGPTGGTIARYAPDGFQAPDFKGLIGVTPDGVEGVDVPRGQFVFSETHFIDDGQVTTGYKLLLRNLTGTSNDAIFKGHAAGECVFLGAFGRKRGVSGKWEITFTFISEQNATDLTVGDITGIAKQGSDYLWVLFEDDVDDTAHKLVKVPRAVYVERVARRTDFSLLGIGT